MALVFQPKGFFTFLSSYFFVNLKAFFEIINQFSGSIIYFNLLCSKISENKKKYAIKANSNQTEF